MLTSTCLTHWFDSFNHSLSEQKHWEDLVNNNSSFLDFVRFHPYTYAHTQQLLPPLWGAINSILPSFPSAVQVLEMFKWFQYTITAQKMNFFMKYFVSKCDQICRKLQTWSDLLKIINGNLHFLWSQSIDF